MPRRPVSLAISFAPNPCGASPHRFFSSLLRGGGRTVLAAGGWALFGEQVVGDRLVGERVEPDELALCVVGKNVRALDRLAIKVNRGQDNDLVAVSNEVPSVSGWLAGS